MVQAGQKGCGSHGSYGKQETEMRMKGMGTGDHLHKAGKQVPDIVFQNSSPLYDKHFSPVFILVDGTVQQGTDGFIQPVGVELLVRKLCFGRICNKGQAAPFGHSFQKR